MKIVINNTAGVDEEAPLPTESIEEPDNYQTSFQINL